MHFINLFIDKAITFFSIKLETYKISLLDVSDFLTPLYLITNSS